MQSWGTQSRFSVRDTGREPSKSGVVGLIGAAMGIPRDDEDAIARIPPCAWVCALTVRVRSPVITILPAAARFEGGPTASPKLVAQHQYGRIGALLSG